jgi:hypothetical protein
MRRNRSLDVALLLAPSLACLFSVVTPARAAEGAGKAELVNSFEVGRFRGVRSYTKNHRLGRMDGDSNGTSPDTGGTSGLRLGHDLAMFSPYNYDQKKMKAAARRQNQRNMQRGTGVLFSNDADYNADGSVTDDAAIKLNEDGSTSKIRFDGNYDPNTDQVNGIGSLIETTGGDGSGYYKARYR